LDMTHVDPSDLIITLTSPSNTNVILLDENCGGNDDLSITFDDSGASHGSIPCSSPQGGGGTYQPFGKITDTDGGTVGTLNSWCLDITEGSCPPEVCNNNVDDDLDGFTDCEDPDCSCCVAGVTATGLPANLTNTITISDDNCITDVNIYDLYILHNEVDNIRIELTSPEGTTIRLIDRPCDDENNLYMDFDDAGGSQNAWPCPPLDGLAYQPEDLFSVFDGENANGDWVLEVFDRENDDVTGQLISYCLEVLTEAVLVCLSVFQAVAHQRFPLVLPLAPEVV